MCRRIALGSEVDMGIYIKGITKDEFLDMYHQSKQGTYIGFDPDAITEVATPHGRLIDADRYEFYAMLCNEPTVIGDEL